MTFTFALTFALKFTLTFTLTFSLTCTLHLQIDGASSRSIERYFLIRFLPLNVKDTNKERSLSVKNYDDNHPDTTPQSEGSVVLLMIFGDIRFNKDTSKIYLLDVELHIIAPQSICVLRMIKLY